jgi:hypothetical protein
MPVIPPRVLEKLYVQGSLRVKEGGFVFELKNLIAPATITGVEGLDADGERIDASRVAIELPSGNLRPIGAISPGRPLQFAIGMVVTVHVSGETLGPGQHDLALCIAVKEIGSLDIPVSDLVA